VSFNEQDYLACDGVVYGWRHWYRYRDGEKWWVGAWFPIEYVGVKSTHPPPANVRRPICDRVRTTDED